MSDTDGQNSHSFVHSSYLSQMSLLVELQESSGGRVRSYPQPASPSPWFSTLTNHLGDEQYACWWPLFWDIISPHHNQSITWRPGFEPGSVRVGFVVNKMALERFCLRVIWFPPPPHPDVSSGGRKIDPLVAALQRQDYRRSYRYPYKNEGHWTKRLNRQLVYCLL
jgi:hypothetical protein